MQPRPGSGSSIARFYRVYPGATPLMRADRSALGTIPAAAHQYCEALCSASAYGWYAFPPADVRLKWNGVDVFHECDGMWEPLASKHLPDYLEYWNGSCPPDLKDMAPPFLSSLFVPGVVQIWSGFLASTAENWSLLVRPLVNTPQSRLYSCYEGIMETDRYGPAPLFVNLRLIATDTVIEFQRLKPLFQVQPVLRTCYTDAVADYCEEPALSREDWEGYKKTIRTADPAEDSRQVGSYAVQARKRAKGEPRA